MKFYQIQIESGQSLVTPIYVSKDPNFMLVFVGEENVYLGAACLPLNVLENQTRARSSVPAKPEGEWRAALAAL